MTAPQRLLRTDPLPWHSNWEPHRVRGADGPAEERLRRLAAAVGPLRRVLAAIAERLIATRAHEKLCFARISDYARERPGISARQLQVLARVHRALAELRALERALVTNELPWSKVRLIARVARERDERAWIALAISLPTRELERKVREHAGGSDPDAIDEPLTSVHVRCTPAVSEKWCLVHELAERVAGERLLSGEALEWIAAEAFSATSLESAFIESDDEAPARAREPFESSAAGEYSPDPRSPSQDLPRAVASLAAQLEEADAFELDRRLCAAVRLEQTLDAAIAPLLRVVTCSEFEWSRVYQPLSSYAPEQLGFSPSKARALLRLERAGDVCPELRDAFRSGRLSWVKAQCLIPLLLLDLDGEWRPIWVAWAQRVTVRRLAADVERALLLRAGHDLAWQRCKFAPEHAQDPIPSGERQLCAPDVDPEATQELTWRVPREVALLFTAVRETLRARVDRLLMDGEVFDLLLDHAIACWTQRNPHERRPDPVVVRDGYRCAVPGCLSRRNLHDHHVIFRSHCGSDAFTNRITLCAFHHQRNVHSGLMRVWGRAPADLVFDLPLARYRSGDVVIPRSARIFDNSSAIAARARSASWRTVSRRNVVESDAKGGAIGSR